jgi:hypothetical protein
MYLSSTFKHFDRHTVSISALSYAFASLTSFT